MAEEKKNVEFLFFSKMTALLLWIVTGGRPFSLAAHVAHGPVTKVTQVDIKLMLETVGKYPKLDCVETDSAFRSLVQKLRIADLVKKAKVEGEKRLRARCLILEWTVSFDELKAAFGLSDLDVGYPIPVVEETPAISTNVTSNEASTTNTTTDAIDYSAAEQNVLFSMYELHRLFPNGFSRADLRKLNKNSLSCCQATYVAQLYDRVRNQARRPVPHFVVNNHGFFSWKADFIAYLSSSSTPNTTAAPAKTTPVIVPETITPAAAPEPVEPTEVPTEKSLPKTTAETRARLAEIERRRVVISDAKNRLNEEDFALGEEMRKLYRHLDKLETEERAKNKEIYKQWCEANGFDPLTMAKNLAREYFGIER